MFISVCICEKPLFMFNRVFSAGEDLVDKYLHYIKDEAVKSCSTYLMGEYAIVHISIFDI